MTMNEELPTFIPVVAGTFRKLSQRGKVMARSVEAAGSIIVPNFASAFSYDVVSSLTALFRAVDKFHEQNRSRKTPANQLDSEIFKGVYGVSVALEQLIKTVECDPVVDESPAPLSYEGHWPYLILYAMASVVKDETKLWETRVMNLKTLANHGELLERASAVLIALKQMEEATESLMHS